jgi:hypothetical protein
LNKLRQRRCALKNNGNALKKKNACVLRRSASASKKNTDKSRNGCG